MLDLIHNVLLVDMSIMVMIAINAQMSTAHNHKLTSLSCQLEFHKFEPPMETHDC